MPLQQFLQVAGEMDDAVAIGEVAGAVLVVAVYADNPGAGYIALTCRRRLLADRRDHFVAGYCTGARKQEADGAFVDAARG